MTKKKFIERQPLSVLKTQMYRNSYNLDRLSRLRSLLLTQSSRQNILSALIASELKELETLRHRLQDILNAQTELSATLESEAEGLNQTKRLEAEAKKDTVLPNDAVLVTIMKIITDKGNVYSL